MKQTLPAFLLAGICMVSPGTGHAQDVRTRSGASAETAAQPVKEIRGRVLTPDGSPLVGATVRLLDRAGNVVTGTYTDANGYYTLSASDPANQTVSVSYVNFNTVSLPAAGSDFAVTMQEADNTLDDVVIQGYGAQERAKLTSSIATVQGEALANIITPSFENQLAGRAAGVAVTVGNGLLGVQPRIRIRGQNSINSDASPLIVIDNMPVVDGNFSSTAANSVNGSVNPEDIESIEILKDASATAIYGSRGANGVIIITTKRGKVGKPTINYSSQVGVAEVYNRFDVLNANEFITIINETRANSGLSATAFDNGYDTDWQDFIFRPALQHNHALSLRGGTEALQYFFSLGGTFQEGVVVNNALNRYTARFNVDAKPTKWLNFGVNAAYSHTFTTGLNTGRNSLGGNLFAALSQIPNIPAFLPNGAYNITGGGGMERFNNTLAHASNAFNIKFTLDQNQQTSKQNRMQGGTYFEIIPVEGLRIRSYLAVDQITTDDWQFSDPRHGDGRGANGSNFRNFVPFLRWNWQNTATYQRTIAEDHNLTALVGYEAQRDRQESFNASGQNLALPFFRDIITGTFITPQVGGFAYRQSFVSTFGRLNYDYKGKYLLQATVRRDGSSDLAEANRFQTFPGASVAWRLSEEEFFKSLNQSVVNDVKFRASWGRVGNANVGLFIAQPLYGPAQYGSQAGIGYTQPGNPDLKWETSTQTNFGLDLGMFNNRMTLTVETYRNETDDLILFVPAPLSAGVPGNAFVDNVGKMTNTGVELAVSGDIIRKPNGLTWNSSFNIAFQRNEVNELVTDIIGAFNITRVGESIGSLWGFETWGVNPANGNPVWRKADGTLVQWDTPTNRTWVFDPSNPASLIDRADYNETLSGADKKVLGNTLPTFLGGWRNTFTWKGFDAEVFFTFGGGNKIFNATRVNNLDMRFNNKLSEVLERWTPSNPNTDVPKQYDIQADNINRPADVTTRFVEDGDFIRLQILSLGYTLPQDFVRNTLGLQSVRFFVQGQNLYVWTDYTGADPEINSNGAGANTTFGLDYNTNPLQRTYLLGVNVTF